MRKELIKLGVLREPQPESQSTHFSLNFVSALYLEHPQVYRTFGANGSLLQDSFHRLHPCSSMGDPHSLSPQIDSKIHPLRRFRRPLLRRRFHSWRL